MQTLKLRVGELLVGGIAVLAIAGPAGAAPSADAIRADIERAMAAFDSPGMTVAVVHGGDVHYAAGHGVIEIGSRDPVDEHTLFQIGSVSKAFTAAALAVLADDGKLGWDDPVIDHVPEFRLYDAWVTREFTIRDLLTHRSGLPLGAGDLLMFPDGNATPDEIIRALRHFEPASSFRSEFAYDNLLYIVAGEVIARVSGVPFTDFLESRVLAPIGMQDCVATAERAGPDAVLATPHIKVDDKLETTTTRVTSLVAAAGGIACSARSMARWMAFILAEGKTDDGEQLISKTQFAELTKPVTLLPASGYLAEHAGTFLNAYALGWGVSTFYGEPMLSHGGGVWGVTTFIAVLPERNLAVFASNNQMSVAPRAVVNDIIDAFLEESPWAGNDWVAILQGLSGDRSAAADKVVEEAWAARDADSTPSLPLGAYTGTYRDPWYGTVRISFEDGRLHFHSDRNEPLQGPLEHFQHDTFIARWSDRRLHADAYVRFMLGLDGDVERIRMQAVSPATDFSYDFHDLDLEKVVTEAPRGGN